MYKYIFVIYIRIIYIRISDVTNTRICFRKYSQVIQNSHTQKLCESEF